MAVRTTHKGKRSRCSDVLHRPRGLFHSRVQQVGPEHFGIVSVDCAKARSKWMLADFYGKVLIPPTVVAHNRVELDATIAQIRQALTTNGLYDMLVAIERTHRAASSRRIACMVRQASRSKAPTRPNWLRLRTQLSWRGCAMTRVVSGTRSTCRSRCAT